MRNAITRRSITIYQYLRYQRFVSDQRDLVIVSTLQCIAAAVKDYQNEAQANTMQKMLQMYRISENML